MILAILVFMAVLGSAKVAESKNLDVLSDKGISLIALGQNVCPIAEKLCCTRLNSQQRAGLADIFRDIVGCARDLIGRFIYTAEISFAKACCPLPTFKFLCPQIRNYK